MFAIVYLLYDASRWVFAGRLPTAAAHARWVIHLERSMDLATERSVQRAFEWGVAEWLLSNVYLAAQLVVLPASLIWLYRTSASRSPSGSRFGRPYGPAGPGRWR